MLISVDFRMPPGAGGAAAPCGAGRSGSVGTAPATASVFRKFRRFCMRRVSLVSSACAPQWLLGLMLRYGRGERQRIRQYPDRCRQLQRIAPAARERELDE